MEPLLISNAKVVNEGLLMEADVLIEHGRISAIGACQLPPNTRVLDAAGRYLLPGMIDNQVNFREPGMTLVADLASESLAAVAGGVTSFLDLPDPVSNTTTLEELEDKVRLAQGRVHANYGFYVGASADNIEMLAGLNPGLACAISLQLGGEEGDNRLLDDPELIEVLFERTEMLVVAHCEDMPMILENEESYRGIYSDRIPLEFHSVIRSDEACARSMRLVQELALRQQHRLHLMSISSAAETELLSDQPFADKLVTAGVRAPFLHFSDEDYAVRGELIKDTPAIKSAEDRAGLIQALLEGKLDLVCSGHAPQLIERKQLDSYFQAPAGMPMVQHGLLALLEHYHDGILSMEQIAELTSHRVADLYGMAERGYIREGYWADLVLIDAEQGGMATHGASISRCGWTPFDGYLFRSSIAATIVNGSVVWQDGKFTGSAAAGMALRYRSD